MQLFVWSCPHHRFASSTVHCRAQPVNSRQVHEAEPPDPSSADVVDYNNPNVAGGPPPRPSDATPRRPSHPVSPSQHTYSSRAVPCLQSLERVNQRLAQLLLGPSHRPQGIVWPLSLAHRPSFFAKRRPLPSQPSTLPNPVTFLSELLGWSTLGCCCCGFARGVEPNQRAWPPIFTTSFEPT